MAIIQTLRIEVAGKIYTVTGDGFYEMLSQVKDIQGRRWDGDRRLWVIPSTIEEVRSELEDLQILSDEEEVLDAEIAEIEQCQKEVSERIAEIQAYADAEYAKAKSYSFKSKSRYKAAALQHYGCLSVQTPFKPLLRKTLTSSKKRHNGALWLNLLITDSGRRRVKER